MARLQESAIRSSAPRQTVNSPAANGPAGLLRTQLLHALLCVLGGIIFCVPASTRAVTKTWDAGGTAGDWGIGANWNTNGPPTLDDVLFDNSSQSPLEDIFLKLDRATNSLTLNLTEGSNQNWNLGSDSSTGAFTLTLATGNISVLSTSGTGTYIIGATTGTGIGTGIMTLATGGSGFTLDNSRTNGGLLQINAIVSGSLSTVTKTGAGTVVLSGANTYTGSTTISGGTLTAATASGSALGSTSAITVNSGGTLLLGADDQINNAASITLDGGTFARGDFNEGSISTAGVGALTLSAAGSNLDFGTGTVGTLTFASFTSGGNTLTIDNWTGTANTVGTASTDRLIFDVDQSGNLSSFSFTGYSGAGASQFDLGNGYYEITPGAVPESATYFAALLAVGALVYYQVRRKLNAASSAIT